MQIRFNTAALMGALMVLMMPAFAVLAADHQPPRPQPVERTLLASGLMGTIGSTIGPDGALYVAEGALGRITRIDRSSGKATTFATGLPAAVPGVGIGGPIDVAFVGTTAYVLVSLVDSTVGGNQKDGIYRVDGKNNSTLIADLGTWSFNNPPTPAVPFSYFLPDGLQFALQPIGDGFLVSDGHLNRILRVSKDGSEITVLKQFNAFLAQLLPGSSSLVRTVMAAGSTPVFTSIAEDPLLAPYKVMDVEMSAAKAQGGDLLAKAFCRVDRNAKVLQLDTHVTDTAKLAGLTLKDINLAMTNR
jgi:hypothetical protein